MINSATLAYMRASTPAPTLRGPRTSVSREFKKVSKAMPMRASTRRIAFRMTWPY